MMTPSAESTSGTSYDTSCAAERKPPKSEYFEPEAQPPEIIAMTFMVVMAKRNNTPMLRSRTMTPSPKGMTTKATTVGANAKNGATLKTGRSHTRGVVSSFCNNLNASATVWTAPCQPTRMGPNRSWIWADTLRVSHMRNKTNTAMKAPIRMAAKTISPKTVTQDGNPAEPTKPAHQSPNISSNLFIITSETLRRAPNRR